MSMTRTVTVTFLGGPYDGLTMEQAQPPYEILFPLTLGVADYLSFNDLSKRRHSYIRGDNPLEYHYVGTVDV